jgi:hypothetical protein
LINRFPEIKTFNNSNLNNLNNNLNNNNLRGWILPRKKHLEFLHFLQNDQNILNLGNKIIIDDVPSWLLLTLPTLDATTLETSEEDVLKINEVVSRKIQKKVLPKPTTGKNLLKIKKEEEEDEEEEEEEIPKLMKYQEDGIR